MKSPIELDSIAFIGRTMDEYMRMFGLDDALLRRGPVLDCPGGAASLAAEAYNAGFDVTAIDILYDLSPDALEKKGMSDIALIYEKVRDATGYFRWDTYGNVEGLIAVRQRALRLFMEDFGPGKRGGRYIAASLPSMPFRDDTFELVLCSHLLFLYGKMLGTEFQKRCLEEMIRVASQEVRVYPLHGFDLAPCLQLGEIMEHLRFKDHEVEAVEVPFEFLRGSNVMLRIKKRKETRHGKF